MSGVVQQASKVAAAAKQQLPSAPDISKGASLRAGAVVDRATSHPQVQQALQQAQAASDLASAHADKHYRGLLRANHQYVLGNGPSFFVNKNNVWKYAVFTTLAGCASALTLDVAQVAGRVLTAGMRLQRPVCIQTARVEQTSTITHGCSNEFYRCCCGSTAGQSPPTQASV